MNRGGRTLRVGIRRGKGYKLVSTVPLRQGPLAALYKRTYHAHQRWISSFKILRMLIDGGGTPLWQIRSLREEPIIVGGCGRSGTSLLLAVLSCHPRIFAIPNETGAFCPDGYSYDPDYSIPFRVDLLHRALLGGDIPDTCTRWAEKTPKNVHTFERIIRHFDGRVRCIHIVRDGRDVVLSRHPGRPDTSHVAPDRWISDVRAGAHAERLPQVFAVRYEDLVLDYEETVRRLCEFLELPFADELLEYPSSARVRTHLAWNDGVRPLNPSSIGKWRSAQDSASIQALLGTPGAHDLLERYGYPADRENAPTP